MRQTEQELGSSLILVQRAAPGPPERVQLGETTPESGKAADTPETGQHRESLN